MKYGSSIAKRDKTEWIWCVRTFSIKRVWQNCRIAPARCVCVCVCLPLCFFLYVYVHANWWISNYTIYAIRCLPIPFCSGKSINKLIYLSLLCNNVSRKLTIFGKFSGRKASERFEINWIDNGPKWFLNWKLCNSKSQNTNTIQIRRVLATHLTRTAG